MNARASIAVPVLTLLAAVANFVPASADPFHDSLRKLQQRTKPAPAKPSPNSSTPSSPNRSGGAGHRRPRRSAALPIQPRFLSGSAIPPPKAGPPALPMLARSVHRSYVGERIGKNPQAGDVVVTTRSSYQIMINQNVATLGHAEATDLKPGKKAQIQIRKPNRGSAWRSFWVEVRPGKKAEIRVDQ